MEIFIDSAHLEEIEKAKAMGLVDGVTTNPTLVAKAGVKFEDLLHRICEVVDGPISAEVVATDAKGMIAEAARMKKEAERLSPNVVPAELAPPPAPPAPHASTRIRFVETGKV